MTRKMVGTLHGKERRNYLRVFKQTFGKDVKFKRRTNQRKKFSRAVKKCHRTTKTKEAFGRCMSKNLKK